MGGTTPTRPLRASTSGLLLDRAADLPVADVEEAAKAAAAGDDKVVMLESSTTEASWSCESFLNKPCVGWVWAWNECIAASTGTTFKKATLLTPSPHAAGSLPLLAAAEPQRLRMARDRVPRARPRG